MFFIRKIVYSFPQILYNMTLNDIRKQSWLVIVFIGAAIVAFLLMDWDPGQTAQSNNAILLKVDNRKTSINEFISELEDNITYNIKYRRLDPITQRVSTEITEVQRWGERADHVEQKIKEIILEKKLHESGVFVSDAEAWDLVSGYHTGNQHPTFTSYFDAINPKYNAADSTAFETVIHDWISNGNTNPQWPSYLYYEDQIIRGRAHTKYYNAIKKGLYVTQADMRQNFIEKEGKLSGQYVYIDCNNTLDEFLPSEKEIEKYYKNNKEDFSTNSYRELNYFIFDLEPSDFDKANLIQEMASLIQDRIVFNQRLNKEIRDLGFMNIDTADSALETFVNQNSEGVYQIKKFSKEDFNKLSELTVLNQNILQPYFEKDTCKMGRIIESGGDTISVVFLTRQLYVSDQTEDQMYAQILDFISQNKTINNPQEVSKKLGKQLRNATVEKMDILVSGLGPNRSIVKWAFGEETTLNQPELFDLEDKYIIAFLSKKVDDGTRPFDEVRDDILTLLQTKNMADKLILEINNANHTSISDLAQEFNTKIKPISNQVFSSDIFQSEGYNPGAVGAFFGCNSKELSSPFIGENGVFVFYKSSDLIYDDYTIDSGSAIQLALETKLNLSIDNRLIESLKENKTIIDNSFNFY